MLGAIYFRFGSMAGGNLLLCLKRGKRLEEEVSQWVMKKVKGLSNFAGIPCQEFENDALELIKGIEANYRSVLDENLARRVRRSTRRCARELKDGKREQ